MNSARYRTLVLEVLQKSASGKSLGREVGDPLQWKESPWLGFDADAVVHGSLNPLLAAEIAFCCLHRNVPEKELDLIQFST